MAKRFSAYPVSLTRPLWKDKFLAALSILILVPLLFGCTVGPDYTRPETPLPAQWRGVAQPAAGAADEGNLTHWRT